MQKATFGAGCFWQVEAAFREVPGVIDAVFYAYAAPEPDGFKASRIAPAEAFYDGAMSEFFLKYADVRSAPSPRKALLDFMQSTYEASANLAGWNRRELERG